MNLVRMEPSLKGDEFLTFHCSSCQQYQDLIVPVNDGSHRSHPSPTRML